MPSKSGGTWQAKFTSEFPRYSPFRTMCLIHFSFANLRVTKPKPNADWRRGFDAAVQSVESAIAPMIQGWLQNPRDGVFEADHSQHR